MIKRSLRKFLVIVSLASMVILNGYSQILAAESTFESVQNWNLFESSDGHTYVPLIDLGNLLTYTWEQPVTFDPAAANVTSATLSLTHKWNANIDSQWSFKGEVWLLSNGEGTLVGQLNGSNTSWVTDVFDITSLFGSFTGDSITLALQLSEKTQWIDSIWLDKSVISGTYNPVPIPGSALLLGSSLLGLIGVGSRRKAH